MGILNNDPSLHKALTHALVFVGVVFVVASGVYVVPSLIQPKKSSRRLIAEGASGTMYYSFGDCGNLPGTYPGVFTIACSDHEEVVCDVRPVAELAIVGPASSRVNEPLEFHAKAFDNDGNELELGDQARLFWKFSGTVIERSHPDCGDIIPNCPVADHGYALGVRAGLGTVAVSLGSRRAETALYIAQ